MITELDIRYLVLKLDDIYAALSQQEIDTINACIGKIDEYRRSVNKVIDKQYMVVSETMKCYPRVKQMVLDEVNETTD